MLFRSTNGGSAVAGLMKNFGYGDTTITNSGSKGINVSGTMVNGNGNTYINNSNGAVNVSGNITNQNGLLNIDNTGSGILVASTGKLTNSKGVTNITNTGSNGIVFEYGSTSNNSTHETNITNSGANGVHVRGNVSSNGINVINRNSDVILGYSSGSNNLNSTSNVNIGVTNGNVFNYGTKANLIKANGNLNINTTNGAIGKEVGACEGGVCTGINEADRDLTKSVNTSIAGTTTAISSGTNSLVNLTSLNSNMNVNQIKSDGRVILLADSSVKGATPYNIVNRASNSSNPNVEGTGISIIASGNIGEANKALTFRQNGINTVFYGDDARNSHVLTPVNKNQQGVDMLAIGDINVNGMDSASGDKVNTNVCAIVSRTGDVNAEFSGDTYIEETTSANKVNITTRGKNLYVNNLGQAPNTYRNNRNDYYGPNNSVPAKAVLTALDLGSYWSESENPQYIHAADSTIVVKNGKLDGQGLGRPAHEQDLTLIADNAYAGGYYFNMGKHRGADGKSTVTQDDTTNPINTLSGKAASIRGKAVRPEDVTAIGKDEDDRNYYYGGSTQGSDKGYDGVKNGDDYVDSPTPDQQGGTNDDDNLVVPEDEDKKLKEQPEKVKEAIKARKEEEAKNKYIDEVLEAASKNMKVEINDEIIDDEIHRMMNQFAEQLKMQGLSMEQYFQFTGSSHEDMHKQMEPEATKRVKYRYLIEEVAIAEKVEITDKEADKEAENMAKNYGMTKEEFLEELAKINIKTTSDQLKKLDIFILTS